MRLKKSVSALTLAELVLSLGLLAVLIISLIGLFTRLLHGSTKSTNLTAGQLFAAQKLEQLITTGSYATDLNGQAGAYVTDVSSKTNFYYQVSRSNISQSTAKTETTYLGGFYVTVRVWWNVNSPNQARAGEGLQTTQASRMVYPRVAVP